MTQEMETHLEECTTPKNMECRIPPARECPPAPRKKTESRITKREPPKNGYFQPPDLDKFFAMGPRTTREACA